MSDLPPPPPPPHGFTPPPPGDFAPPPPGYVAYGGPGAVMQGIEPTAGIAKAIVVLMAVSVPLYILNIFDTITAIDDAKQFLRDGGNGTFQTSTGLGALASFLVLPTGILTMIWMFRMAKNLRVIGRPGATWGPGWGIGGWFVPPAYVYVVPWLMFRELWKGSDPDVAPYDPNWKKGSVDPLITVWWVTFGLLPLAGLVSSVGMFASITSLDSRDAAQRLEDFGTITIALAALQVVNAVIYLFVVRRLSARHLAATSPR